MIPGSTNSAFFPKYRSAIPARIEFSCGTTELIITPPISRGSSCASVNKSRVRIPYSSIVWSRAVESRQFANIAQSLLPFATDVSLDLIGEIFGVRRLTAQNASVDITEQNFEWYVRNGTFGSINGGQDIVVPAGVQIYTAAQNGSVYTLSTAVTCPAGASSQYFSATSLLSGSAGNAASGIFALSNFTGYTEPSAHCW